MKMNIKHYSKSTLSVVLALCMLLSCLTIGVVPTDAAKVEGESVGYDAHFYLIDEETNWAVNNDYKVGTTYSTNKYYLNAKLENNSFFALHNGADQYGPQVNDFEINVGGEYNNPIYVNYAWKFVGDTQVVRVCVDESNSEWYPKLTLESIDWYVSGFINSSDTTGNGYKMTKNSFSDYTYTFTSNGTDQYIVINDGKNLAYHPENHSSGSGTSANYTDGNKNADNKWMIPAGNNGDRITVKWNPQTQMVTWTINPVHNVTCATATGGTVSASPTTAASGTNITVTASPATGYTYEGIFLSTGGMATTIGNTSSFTMPASDVTVTPYFTEITHSVKVKRRFYKADGTLDFEESYTYENISGVGIDTAQQVSAAAATFGDYSFRKFTLPSGVTLSSGDLNTPAAIYVNATVDNATIYIDYDETLYSITISNNGHGTVQCDGANVSSVSLGNISSVTLTAANDLGYVFDHWTVKPGTATSMTVNGNTVSLSGSSEQTFTGNETASSTFRFNGTATLKAYFVASRYTINASFPEGNTYTTNSATGNNVTVSADGDTIGSTYRIVVLLAPGYEVASVTSSNYAYLPYEMDLVTGSESVYKYTIKISKLKDDYKLDFTGDNKIIIEYIIVENKYVTSGGIYDARPETGRFELNSTARITGEAWLKANSTNLTFFNIISYGSVTNHFLAVTEDGDFLLDSALNGVHGTGIITDEDEIYKAQYAANDGTSNTIHYKLDASAKAEAKFGDYTYSFDRWIVFKTPMNGLNTTTGNGLTEVTIPSGAEDYTTSRDIHLTSVPLYNNGEGDKTYVAVYKFVNFNSPVRVNVTYHFEDFDTTDGNYVFDENKGTKPATYTKYLTSSETNYDTLLSSTTTLQNMARDNAPRVESNYFHYSFSTERLPEINSDNCDSTFKVIAVDAYLKEEARDYTIIYNGTSYTGNYQQTKELTTNVSNPVWKLKSYSFDGTATETVVCTESTYRAKFVATGSADNGTNDCQVITVSSGSGSVANGKTVVTNSYTEIKNENDTTRLHHNFFIADFCEEGKLIGGGVLFATAVNGHYRYSSADNILNAPATREVFIRDILNGNYDIDYPAQSINNIGFRYKKFKSAEDVYRYSNDYSAYLTVFEGTNVNSVNYSGQKLRLFSFMVYDNNGTTTIVTSDGYAEVDRYLP